MLQKTDCSSGLRLKMTSICSELRWGRNELKLGADFVDIEHCYVYTYDPKDGSHTKFQLPEHCSTVCLTEDPDKLVTTLIK